MYICICKGITDSQIEKAVTDGQRDFSELADRMGITSECGRCEQSAREVFELAVEAQREAECSATAS